MSTLTVISFFASSALVANFYPGFRQESKNTLNFYSILTTPLHPEKKYPSYLDFLPFLYSIFFFFLRLQNDFVFMLKPHVFFM